MKIEANEDAVWVSVIMGIALVLTVLIISVAAYNMYPFYKGYSEQQENSTTATMWVKNK